MKWTIIKHGPIGQDGIQLIRVQYNEDLEMIVKTKSNRLLLTSQILTPKESGYTLEGDDDITIKIIEAFPYSIALWAELRRER